MLYHLTFRTHALKLPFAYQTKVQGFVYHLLRSNPEYSSFLHNSGYTAADNRRFKLFCFSLLRGRYTVQDKLICFPDRVSFQLRTADPLLAEILSQSLQPGRHFVLGGQPVELESVEVDTLALEGRELKIRTASPITVFTTLPDRKTRYYTPLDREFSTMVNENYRRKWESACGEPATDEVEIEALSVGMRDKMVTKIKGTYVTAWGGTYLLRGAPRALEFLYHTGLGAKNSMGFGLFDLIGDRRRRD